MKFEKRGESDEPSQFTQRSHLNMCKAITVEKGIYRKKSFMFIVSENVQLRILKERTIRVMKLYFKKVHGDLSSIVWHMPKEFKHSCSILFLSKQKLTSSKKSN